MARVSVAESAKARMLEVLEQWLARELADFSVRRREITDRTVQLTVVRGEEGLPCRIRIAPHFLEHHSVALEIETFLEHHALHHKLRDVGVHSIVIDNAGVHVQGRDAR